MAGKRKSHSATFKAQVALAALKGDKTINELATQFTVHPTLIHAWKKLLLEDAHCLFDSHAKNPRPPEDKTAELFEQIGRLKNVSPGSVGSRSTMFETSLGHGNRC